LTLPLKGNDVESVTCSTPGNLAKAVSISR
jgi:hypothetical protein